MPSIRIGLTIQLTRYRPLPPSFPLNQKKNQGVATRTARPIPSVHGTQPLPLSSFLHIHLNLLTPCCLLGIKNTAYTHVLCRPTPPVPRLLPCFRSDRYSVILGRCSPAPNSAPQNIHPLKYVAEEERKKRRKRAPCASDPRGAREAAK